METENWKNIKDVLLEVLSRDAAERRAFWETADVTDEVRREVESLLAFEEESENSMRLPAAEFSKDFFGADDNEKNGLIGRSIGVYEIVGELGIGGMGAVYLAKRSDGKFEQKVALKLLKREMNTTALRQRFGQEREILASLVHPNIARLLDAGTTDDAIPFIAMEYVEGLAITEYCHRHDLDLGARLNLFRAVCSTIAFAHRNLIVHRDLKPSNILVTEEGNPKLLDFGISKILSNTIENLNPATVTKLGAMTPVYASPEQMRGQSVTTAADIYSLGVILYELLSGHRPFETAENDLKEIYRAVIDAEPPLPSAMAQKETKSFGEITNAPTAVVADSVALNRTAPNDFRRTAPNISHIKPQYLRGDLDNIILKALKKEPERRYSSAENFADDIKRHLDGLPVAARPDTFAYRAEKFIRRNSFFVLAGTLIALAILGGAAATFWQARVAQAERAKAERRFRDVRALANSFLFEFSPQIENLPGSTPARKLLVTRGLEYLDNLSQESTGDWHLQRELAAAYEKVGDVQGNPHNPNVGDIKGALQSYEKALPIRRKLLETEPENVAAQSDLANNLQLIADIQTNGGDYAQAAGFYEEALKWREKSVEVNPTDYEAREKLANTVRLRGLIPFYEGDNKKAIEYYARARNIYEQLHGERPGDDHLASDYAYMFVHIGEAQGWDGEPERGGENLQTGLKMLIELGAKHPHDHRFQRALNLAYSKTGENYEDVKNYEQSIYSFGKALEIAQKSSNADPQSFQSKRDVALAYKKLSQTLDIAGKSQESLEKITTAFETFQELSRIDPNNAETVYDVANTRFSIGETYLSLKDYEKALETHQKAKAEFQTVLDINPGNTYAARVSSFNLNRIGKCYAALAEKGKRQEFLPLAIENFRAALDNLNQLKTNGKLSDYDLEEIAAMEKELQETENKIGK